MLPAPRALLRTLLAALLPVLLVSACGAGPSGVVDLGPAPGRGGLSPTQGGAPDAPQTFREVRIYYLTGVAGALRVVPETHSVLRTPRVATSALEELVHGTPQRPEDRTPFPRAARILAVTISEGVATVDWSPEVLAARVSAEEEALGIRSAVLTLTEFPSIVSVRFTVEGRDRGPVPGGRLIEDWWGHVGLSAQPWSRDASRRLLRPAASPS